VVLHLVACHITFANYCEQVYLDIIYRIFYVSPLSVNYIVRVI